MKDSLVCILEEAIVYRGKEVSCQHNISIEGYYCNEKCSLCYSGHFVYRILEPSCGELFRRHLSSSQRSLLEEIVASRNSVFV